jgi:hypothetical protein
MMMKSDGCSLTRAGGVSPLLVSALAVVLCSQGCGGPEGVEEAIETVRSEYKTFGTWASIPGDSLRADYIATNAVIAAGPQPLGRPLTGAATVSVNLLAPATMWGARRNNIDLRLAKILRFGSTRTQVGVDVFNVLNADTVTNYNFGFVPGGSWLTPTAIVPARYARISAQFDF